jgi:TPR repeat protein
MSCCFGLFRALESFQRVHSKHPEASFYIGELLMGMGGLYELDQLAAEGVGGDSGEATSPLTPPPSPPSPSTLAEIQVNVASAFQFYSSASARGHVLSTHRLAQIQLWGGAAIEERADRASIASGRAKGVVDSSYAQRKANRRGRGGAAVPQSCESAAAAFKNVAERGDWAQQLNTAHTLHSAGDRCVAAFLCCAVLCCAVMSYSALSVLVLFCSVLCWRSCMYQRSLKLASSMILSVF